MLTPPLTARPGIRASAMLGRCSIRGAPFQRPGAPTFFCGDPSSGAAHPPALQSGPVGSNVRLGWRRVDGRPYQSIVGQQPVGGPLRIRVRHDAHQHRTELLEHAA